MVNDNLINLSNLIFPSPPTRCFPLLILFSLCVPPISRRFLEKIFSFPFLFFIRCLKSANLRLAFDGKEQFWG